MDLNNSESATMRFGKSPFWVRLNQEVQQFGPSPAWTASIFHRSLRRRKMDADLPLIDITPRKSLFTALVNGETFPLLILNVDQGARGAITFSGSRKMMLRATHTFEWTAKIRPTSTQSGLQLDIQFKASVSPPLPASARGDLKLEVCSPIHGPELWSFPYAPESHRGAVSIWGKLCGVALSIAAPLTAATAAGSHVAATVTGSDTSQTFTHIASQAIRRSRGSYAFSIRFDVARTRTHAHFMHMRHTVASLPPSLPAASNELEYTLRERAHRALQQLTDKGGYSVVGVERVYVKAKARNAGVSSEPVDLHEFDAGFPHFPLDAARSMLDWHTIIGDDHSARLALLIARGIATDFSVIGNPELMGVNKGAFWDRRCGAPAGRGGTFSDFMGDDFHSVASTARIARGLFDVHSRTGDLTSLNAALNACQWLILKQNPHGYYDGDRVCATTGVVIGGDDNLAGIEAVAPLMLAYRATRNEVFVRAAARIMRFVTSHLMPSLVACPIFRTRFATGEDTPASVASLIRALAFMYSESQSRRTREEIEMAATWLRAWDLSQWNDLINNDGFHDGVYEIARAALQMFTIDRNPAWFEIALRFSAALPIEAHFGWQAVPLFFETMISLAAMTEKAQPDLYGYATKIGWFSFNPDSSTNQYIAVKAAEGDDQAANIDYLPLVCRADSKVLLTVLTDRPVENITLSQNGRVPNVRDLITGELECQPIKLHTLPFESPSRYGVFVIEP